MNRDFRTQYNAVYMFVELLIFASQFLLEWYFSIYV